MRKASDSPTVHQAFTWLRAKVDCGGTYLPPFHPIKSNIDHVMDLWCFESLSQIPGSGGVT